MVSPTMASEPPEKDCGRLKSPLKSLRSRFPLHENPLLKRYNGLDLYPAGRSAEVLLSTGSRSGRGQRPATRKRRPVSGRPVRAAFPDALYLPLGIVVPA